MCVLFSTGLPWWLSSKNLSANAGDTLPGLEKSLEEGSSNRLQYSCLGNPMDRGALWVIVHRFAKELVMTQQLNNSKTTLLQDETLWEELSCPLMKHYPALYTDSLREEWLLEMSLL